MVRQRPRFGSRFYARGRVATKAKKGSSPGEKRAAREQVKKWLSTKEKKPAGIKKASWKDLDQKGSCQKDTLYFFRREMLHVLEKPGASGGRRGDVTLRTFKRKGVCSPGKKDWFPKKTNQSGRLTCKKDESSRGKKTTEKVSSPRGDGPSPKGGVAPGRTEKKDVV